MTEMRLQRFLARAGLASRRKCEELITAGKVKVNGTVTRILGTKVDPDHDRVHYEGRRLLIEDHIWILLNKPKGVVSTADDPEGRETVLDIVGNQGARLYPVGRLDYNTEGVLLLTNDGDLAASLMHPRNQIPRVYHVKVKGLIDPLLLDQLRQGVTIDTGEVVSAKVSIVGSTGKHTWIEMILKEGRNRQIHRMLATINCMVLKLVRVAFGGLTAETLPPGRYRSLTQAEINKLRALVKLAGETPRKKARIPGRRNRQGSSGEKTSGQRKSRPRPRDGEQPKVGGRRRSGQRSSVRERREPVPARAKKSPRRHRPKKRGPSRRSAKRP